MMDTEERAPCEKCGETIYYVGPGEMGSTYYCGNCGAFERVEHLTTCPRCYTRSSRLGEIVGECEICDGSGYVGMRKLYDWQMNRRPWWAEAEMSKVCIHCRRTYHQGLKEAPISHGTCPDCGGK